ncbi:hypothetical protein EHI8A_041110 [Entamoeba histolytica HM-1:IMSS-B]|uniref:Uncharacterized protein n=5 Tax=Entamoeba histolytica TaxID=5759 RepID=C4M5Q2_ENTH1|nr:hypothetical protein EHI_129850 [Entamoeba histolytica HM-1:IMSS]EAL46424.1 hypothetical protein EHI_129850 [Entamoeba histolytica HM-1:IMSS]EMH75988.1 hypothetical protein EHI8A_041110 [Entamoeba histolytica HM-1:IMSS-B]ENY63403.1 hypothetical protein EHI7A_041420 [Entamoeba histolytica HM-1:IMSS-A]GAT96772.1 hypothetical protein CL6EHI_129850 [Entamoeba histolytica]|eukprot:XP_651811.1 hypothetical protein EHI_129850 [Entamoeba histolytica HM-1:IMSS]
MSSGSTNSYLNNSNGPELVYVTKIPEIKRMNYPNFSLTITPPNSDIPKILPLVTNIVPIIHSDAQHDFNGNTNTRSAIKPFNITPNIQSIQSIEPIDLIQPIQPLLVSNPHPKLNSDAQHDFNGNTNTRSVIKPFNITPNIQSIQSIEPIQPIQPPLVSNPHPKLNSENTSKRRSKDNKGDLDSSETSSEPQKDHDKQLTSSHKKDKSEQKSDNENIKIKCMFSDLKDDNEIFKDEVITLTQKIFKKHDLRLNKEKLKTLYEFNNQSSLLSASVIQNILYNKTNVMFYFMTEQNLYGAYFSKFGSKPNDDKWMDDEKYRIYSIFRNKQFHLQEWKRKEFQDPDDTSKNILHAYGLFTPLNTEKEVIQTYCGIVVNKDKSMQWDDNFDDYYECTESKNPFFNTKDNRNEKIVKIIIIGQA